VELAAVGSKPLVNCIEQAYFSIRIVRQVKISADFAACRIISAVFRSCRCGKLCRFVNPQFETLEAKEKIVLRTIFGLLVCVILVTAGCNKSASDQAVENANKIMEDAQKQNAKLVDAATEQMKASTEMVKAQTDAAKKQADAATAGAAQSMDAPTKAMQDAQKSMQK
jgi:hypothetical protein